MIHLCAVSPIPCPSSSTGAWTSTTVHDRARSNAPETRYPVFLVQGMIEEDKLTTIGSFKDLGPLLDHAPADNRYARRFLPVAGLQSAP